MSDTAKLELEILRIIGLIFLDLGMPKEDAKNTLRLLKKDMDKLIHSTEESVKAEIYEAIKEVVFS